MAIDKIFKSSNVDDLADNILSEVDDFMVSVDKMQQRKVAGNVQKVIQAFKQIETDLQDRYDNVTNVIEKRVLTIKDGRDGSNGSDGRNGRDGKPGRDGVNGKQGTLGAPGKDGVDGVDGVSVTDASIDFDGSLVISLSSGQQINVGEVVPPELERQLVELRQGGSGGVSNVPKVVAIANATSITVNTDTTDIATQANTQAVGTLTINAPTGTAVNGQKFILRLTSTNVQTFSWNAVFDGSIDITLPTVSSGSSKTDYVGFIYNSTAAKWQMIAKVFGF